MNAMNERKQRTNGSLKIEWLTDYWPTCWQTHWLTDWPTDRPLTYNYKLTDFWLTDWMPPLTDSMTMKKEGLKCLKWLNIINSVYFCFVLFFSVFFFFRFTATNLYDDTWQHTCVTWENTQGVTKLYKDGQFTGKLKHKATRNFKLTAGGFLVLGQDQDSIGGGFSVKETLHGRLASVNMWDKVLSKNDITAQYTNCSVPHGSVFNWSVFKSLTHGNVTVEEPWTKLFSDQTLTTHNSRHVKFLVLVYLL